ncbi:unnamed protein product, partial [Candidula unifasciata]
IVVMLETGFKCSVTGDPHFTGLDYRHSYHLYQTGDYTVYACGATVTCICGVVVREQNDIIRYWPFYPTLSFLPHPLFLPFPILTIYFLFCHLSSFYCYPEWGSTAENDFTHSDGQVSPVCPAGVHCVPVAFTESWRVAGSASLFLAAPKQIQEKPPAQYCSCSLTAQGQSQFTCSPRQHIQDSQLT